MNKRKVLPEQALKLLERIYLEYELWGEYLAKGLVLLCMIQDVVSFLLCDGTPSEWSANWVIIIILVFGGLFVRVYS